GASPAAEHLAVDHRHPAVWITRPLAPGIRDLLQLALSGEALLECPISERRLENSPRPHATPPGAVNFRREAPDGCRALDLGESGFARPGLQPAPRIRFSAACAVHLLVDIRPECETGR